MNERVAITGVGIVCALGRGADEVTAGLLAHRSGAVDVDWAVDLATRQAALVDGLVPDLAAFPDDRKVALLALAAAQVMGETDVPPERRGVFLGTGLSSVTPRELEEDIYPHVRHGRVDRAAAIADLAGDRVAPRRHLPARASGYLACLLGARGPVATTFSACAAGAEAIAAGARSIARGDADLVLAGGHDAMVHPLGIASFEVLGALTHTTARPFDRRRDGFLLGEGAALIRLERADRVSSPPLAYIMGAGTSLDAHGITAPHPQGNGAEAAMRSALHAAGVAHEAVDWISAHATGTPVGDVAEARAVSRVFGDRVRVAGQKGALGHTLAAAGALEAVVCILALSRGFMPGTVGCGDPDDLGIDVMLRPKMEAPGVVLSNSFGFGGQNCSLIFASEGWV